MWWMWGKENFYSYNFIQAIYMSRGFANMWLIIGLVVIIGGVVAWWVMWQKPSTSATLTPSDTYNLLSILPISGSAPLSVNATITPQGNRCIEVAYSRSTLDWGDGTTVDAMVGHCSSQTTHLSHTYTSAGTYIAKLFYIMCLQGTGACDDPFEDVRGTSQITVY